MPSDPMPLSNVIKDRAYSAYENQLEKEVKEGVMPKHIAVIMDGNRRYAKEILGADPIEGHRLGREKLDEVLHWCLDLNIPVLTFYAFSTENFNRAEEEVEYLMDLLEKSLYDFAEDPEVHKFEVAIRVIGDHDMLPERVIKAMEYASERTKGYNGRTLNMAIAYGGRQDIAMTVRAIAQDVLDGKLSVNDINEYLISSRVSTFGLPDPDLVIRTSGEVRISNFLLWQIAYSELYFTDVFWPGFRYIDLLRAIRTYQKRMRRFGE